MTHTLSHSTLTRSPDSIFSSVAPKLIDYSFDELVQHFQWSVPKYFNIAEAVCDKHADKADRLALIAVDESGAEVRYTFGEVRAMANQLAHYFASLGVSRGDRVALILPQCIETAISHIAAHKIGAVSLPLSVLFGADALLYRLRDSGAKVVITDASHASSVSALRAELPELKHLILRDSVNSTDAEVEDFHANLSRFGTEFETVKTEANDPALLIYTSGTTGPPKGALVAHRSLLGNLTGFEMSLDFFPQSKDVFLHRRTGPGLAGCLTGCCPVGTTVCQS